MSKKLEEKIFNTSDWIPLVGAMDLIFRRIPKMNYKMRNSFKTDLYVWANGAYNYALFYGLDNLIK